MIQSKTTSQNHIEQHERYHKISQNKSTCSHNNRYFQQQFSLDNLLFHVPFPSANYFKEKKEENENNKNTNNVAETKTQLKQQCRFQHKSNNTTTNVIVPSSEHVAEIVGKRGNSSIFIFITL